MKKTAVALTLVMLIQLTVLALLPVSAADAGQDLAGHLVVHYDFEGDTVEEALSDKATGGRVSDALHAYTPDNKNTDPTGQTVSPTLIDSDAFRASFDVDTERGTVRNLQAGAALEAVSSEDIRSLYSRDADNNVGAATWFIRFRLDDVSQGGEARLVDMRVNNKSGCMFSVLVSTDGKLCTNAAKTASSRETYFYTTDEKGLVQNGEYVNFMLVMETGTGTSGYTTDMKYTPYVSYGIPTCAEDWIPLQGTDYVSFRTDRLSTAPLSLLDRYDGAGSNNVTLTLDDVRLYNKGLTVEEMSSVFTQGSFDTVHLVGSQTKRNEQDGFYDLRFVAVADALDASRVGFEVTAAYRQDGETVEAEPCSFDTDVVYSSIRAGGETIMASDLGGTYVMALVIGHIPSHYQEVSFEVRPYLLYGETRIYGQTQTVRYRAEELA